MHREYIRENIQYSQERERRAQKSTKLEMLRKGFVEIYSNKDLGKQSYRLEVVFSQSLKL